MMTKFFKTPSLLLLFLAGSTIIHAQVAETLPHEIRLTRHVLDSLATEAGKMKTPRCLMELIEEWIRNKWTFFRPDDSKYFGTTGDGTGVQMAAAKTWYPKSFPKDCFLTYQIRYRYFMSNPDNLLQFPDRLINFDKPFIEHSHQILYRRRQMDILLLTGYKIVFQNRSVLEVSFGGGLTHGEIEEYQYLVSNRPAIYIGWSVSWYL